MKIGQIISEKRKEKGITQQELAEFVGVSKAAVSKWETGLTYPDITLLPLLAAYFDVSMDQLLDYHSQLSAKEIQRLYTMLKKSLEKDSGEVVLTNLRRLVRRYYSCYPFVLQMGLFLMHHFDYFPAMEGENKQQKYMNEAREWFLHVKNATKEVALVNQARNLEAYTLLLLQQPDQVLALLGEYVPAYFPTETLIAGAFQQQGEGQRGIATLQSSIAQYIFVLMSGFTNYLQFLLADEEKFQMTYERGKKIAETFELTTLHPIILMNFQLSAIFGFAQLGKHTQTIEVLEAFESTLRHTDFELELHGDAYFDQIDEWLAQLDLGPQMPRTTRNMKYEFLTLVVDNPLLKPYQNETIIKKLKEVKESQHE